MKSKRIPDEVLPPCTSAIGSESLAAADETGSPAKKRGRKRKHTVVIPDMTNPEETVQVEATFSSLLESGNVILLEDNQQVVEITAEQAQQLGIHHQRN
jgi:hypothetical protein